MNMKIFKFFVGTIEPYPVEVEEPVQEIISQEEYNRRRDIMAEEDYIRRLHEQFRAMEF